MARRRFGIVLSPPPELSVAIDGVRRAIGSPQLDKIEPHITISPPQNVSEIEFWDIVMRLRYACAEVSPFDVTIGGASTFDNNRNVLYFSVDQTASISSLETLARSIVSDRPRLREFVPHVTLYEGISTDMVDYALEVLDCFNGQFVAWEVSILLQDTKGYWTRYLTTPFEDKRSTYRGGSKIDYVAAGIAGPWLQDSINEISIEHRYSLRPSSSAILGLDLNLTRTYLGIADGSYMSACVVFVVGPQAWLDYLWVRSSERNYGKASAILDEVIYRLRTSGIRTLKLRVLDEVRNPHEMRISNWFEVRGASLQGDDLALNIV